MSRRRVVGKRDKRRTAPKRNERRRGLIVTEGLVTEPQYLDQLKQHLSRNLAPFRVCGEGADPLRVVKRALKECRNRDHDWIVCLVDQDQHQTLDEAFQLASENGIQVLVSNPCFEVWLLWHLEDFAQYSDSKMLQKKLRDLKAICGKQHKELDSEFPLANYGQAKARALKADPETTPNRIGPNPSSAMPLLLDLLEAP